MMNTRKEIKQFSIAALIGVALIGSSYFLPSSDYLYRKYVDAYVDAADYTYTMDGSDRVYFERENKDSIFCVLRAGSSVIYKCKENGRTYIYTIDTVNTFKY